MATFGELAVQAIVTIGGGSAVAAGLNGYFSRRATAAAIQQTRAATGKTTAEITGVGAGTAAVQVDTSLDILREMRIDLERVRADADRDRAEVEHARQEAATARQEAATARQEASAARQEAAAAWEGMERLRSWRARQEHRNATHREWDVDVTRRLAAEGISVPAPPPLTVDDQ